MAEPNPKNKDVKGKWSEASMKEAIQQVISGNMSDRRAATSYGVPRSTIQDKVRKLKEGKEVVIKPDMGRFRTTFTENYENQLVNHIRDLDNRLMPLNRKEFLRLAFDLAEALKIKHRFNRTAKCAGKIFYYKFLQRHPGLSLRTAESTSLQRAVGFNKPQVTRFFKHLQELMEKYSFQPTKIFNADETGVSRVHENKLKVLTTKGKKQVGRLTSGERGRTVTVLLCVNACGNQFIPPLYIFPRKKMNDRLKIGAPAGSMFAAQDNGWINGTIFCKWFEEFIKHTHPTKEDPVLLIVDGHCSHKEYKVITTARENNVHILSLPPHSTHKMQPLDRTIMKPFKDAYNEACALWMRRNPFQRITEFEIAALVGTAFTKICRMELAKSGFECSGIYPLNPNIFTDLDFLGAAGLDVPIHHEALTDIEVQPSTPTEPQIETVDETLQKSLIQPQPGTSKDAEPSNKTVYMTPSTLSTSTIDPPKKLTEILNKISPLPVASEKRLSCRKRRAGKSEILTSTPVKDELEAKHLNKNKTVEAAKRNIQLDETSKPNRSRKGKQKSIRRPTTGKSNTNGTNCNICGEDVDDPWIRCDFCGLWSHEACANVESHPLYYKCDNCM